MWQTFPIQFKGGLISNLSPLQHGMTSIGSGAILQNFEPSLSGGYKKVLGYEKLINTEVTGSGTVQPQTQQSEVRTSYVAAKCVENSPELDMTTVADANEGPTAQDS